MRGGTRSGFAAVTDGCAITQLQVAKSQLKRNRMFRLTGSQVAFGTDETDIQGVFVGTDFRDVGCVAIDAQAQHQGAATGEHHLESAMFGNLLFRSARGAQQTQDDGETGANGQHGGEPAIE